MASLGYPVVRVEVLGNGANCTFPFNAPVACLVVPGGPAAYVFFAGTTKVAALTFDSNPDGSLVTHLVAFEVPWSGFRDPAQASP